MFSKLIRQLDLHAHVEICKICQGKIASCVSLCLIRHHLCKKKRQLYYARLLDMHMIIQARNLRIQQLAYIWARIR